MKTRQNRSAARDLDRDLQHLLDEIEKEPLPDRLLELARKLQDALASRRAEGQGD